MSPKSCENGFGLLEAILALAILAASFAVLLGQMRQLADFHFRANRYLYEVRELRNAVALISTIDSTRIQQRVVGDEVRAEYQLSGEQIVFHVRNFGFGGVDMPIARGFSPIQQYVARGRIAEIAVLAKSVPSQRR